MVTEGVEPSTVALLAQRSNRLSYATFLTNLSFLSRNYSDSNHLQFIFIEQHVRSNYLIIEGKDLKSLNTRQYLDATVVPVILQALTEVAK